MPAPAPATEHKRYDFAIVLVCLAVLLGALFHKIFLPEYVVFSNDGPLGLIQAQADYALSNLRGYWQHLNWVGLEQLPGFPGMGYSMVLLLGAVGFSKFIAPLSLLILGLAAWFFFRQLGFHRWVCLLGGLAAALNMNSFSISCWGLSGWTLQRASAFLAFAALVSSPGRHSVLKVILAGFAVGVGIMDGLDVGALFSLYVAAFVVFQWWAQSEGPVFKKLAVGCGRVGVVAICAALIAAHALTALVGTQVKGIVGMGQDEQTKKRRWHEATQWSLPPIETLRIVIPGLFGYYLIENAGDRPQAKAYWGAIAEDPSLSEALKALDHPDEQVRAQAAQAASRMMRRHTGSGEYAGVFVAFVAAWAVAQSFRRKGNPYTPLERKGILFWSGAAVISLLLAYGRYAPLYQLVYALPYFSTIRNPVKFLFPLHFALVILFGYGLQGLWRLYLPSVAAAGQSARGQFGKWWKAAPAFDRKWMIGSSLVFVAALFGWSLYASAGPRLVRHLQAIGFPEGGLADAMARASIAEVGFFVLFLGLSIGLIAIMASGGFGGQRARWAGIAFGLLLAIDLVRADLPWIVFVDYKEKNASNPVIELLRRNPHEQRVTAELAPRTRQFLVNNSELGRFFGGLCYDWLQNSFPYYGVQSLDIIQMPRAPEFDEAFMSNFRPVNPTNLFECGRLWELTNTRYILGMTPVLEFVLNHQVDAVQKRFRPLAAFNLVPKPGLASANKFEHVTTVLTTNGQFAIYEFTGALPRAKLFSHWQAGAQDEETLQRLKDPEFDPARTVLVANDLPAAASTNQNSGTVEVAHYEPRVVQLNVEAAAPSVLLLNDRHHPDWKVWVDGKREVLLRCNYIMRGVYLRPGRHEVEFRFEPPATALCISLISIAVGIGLCGYLATSRERTRPADSGDGSAAPDAPPRSANRGSK